MKRIIALILAVAMLLTLFAACDQNEAETTESEDTMTADIGNTPMPKTKAEALFSRISPDDSNYHLRLAELAVSDIMGHYWIGDLETGYFMPVWKGYPEDLADERGAIWEMAMCMFAVYDMWVITGDETYKQYMICEANYYKENFSDSLSDIETAGALLNTASDDCAWTALFMLNCYTVTEDMWFVERAINLLDDAYARWHDNQLGGGLWYKDGDTAKSLYEVGIALSWLRIWEITGEQRFWDLALESYNWMHDYLGREDGIYAISISSAGQASGRISEAGSCSFLAGNMGMASLHAKLYSITGEQKYLDRVYATNAGIVKNYDINGILLNDRDAWTNGTFATFYASWVLSLPNTEEMQTLLKNTATSIVKNARTADGYYGGSWQGPADGPASIWASNGSVALQTMTSGTSVSIVVAAAMLEAGIDDYVR